MLQIVLVLTAAVSAIPSTVFHVDVITPNMCRMRPANSTVPAASSVAEASVTSTVASTSSAQAPVPPKSVAAASAAPTPASNPEPQQQSSGGYSSSSSFTWYQFKGVGGYCDGKPYEDNAMVIAMSTGIIGNGRSNCQKQVELYAPSTGRSCRVTVVDMCDQNHGCRYDRYIRFLYRWIF